MKTPKIRQPSPGPALFSGVILIVRLRFVFDHVGQHSGGTTKWLGSVETTQLQRDLIFFPMCRMHFRGPSGDWECEVSPASIRNPFGLLSPIVNMQNLLEKVPAYDQSVAGGSCSLTVSPVEFFEPVNGFVKFSDRTTYLINQVELEFNICDSNRIEPRVELQHF